MASGSEPTKNIVLVGRAGNGKSATGNSLIRKQIFRSGAQATGVTMTCQTFRAVTPGGPIINVIDTPGLFDLITKPDIISKEIVRCLTLAEEGLHAVVLVLSVRNRITKEEEDSLCTLQILFGARILDYLIVVFTGGDELDSNGQTLENYLDECPQFLKVGDSIYWIVRFQDIFRLCGYRRILFDNRTKDEEKKDMQIKQLLDHVAAIGRNNNGKPFTEEMHRQIKEETNRLRREEEKAEAKYLAKELEKEKKKLKEAYDRNMTEMTKMVEQAINDACGAHQRMLRVMENMGQRRDQVTRTCNIM